MKVLKVALPLAVVLGVIASGAVSVWLGRGVRVAVERYGPAYIGAPVVVGSVVLSPWSGRGTLRNVIIGNPPGFKGAHALTAGSVEVDLKLSSLAGRTIVVNRLTVREAEVLYELGLGGSNLSRLQRNAEESSSRGSAAPGQRAAVQSLLIKELLVTGGRVGLSATALGGNGARIPLPDVRLTGLGGEGRSPAEAVSAALAAIATAAGKAGGGALGAVGGFLKGKK